MQIVSFPSMLISIIHLFTMDKHIILCFLVLIISGLSQQEISAQPVTCSNKPAWIENFTGKSINQEKWRFETHFDGKLSYLTDPDVGFIQENCI